MSKLEKMHILHYNKTKRLIQILERFLKTYPVSHFAQNVLLHN